MSPDPNEITTALREIPVPPTQITTERAIVLGRKAIRRRRNAVTAAAAVAVVAATAGGFTLARPGPDSGPLARPSSTLSPTLPPTRSPAPFPVVFSWTVTPLPTRGADPIMVTSMDSSGRYIVGSPMASHGAAILWDNLVPVPLPLPVDNVLNMRPVDVNASGAVIGNAEGKSGTFAWLYHDGFATALPAPVGGEKNGKYVARDINDRGDILGWSERLGPVVWPASSPSAVRVLGIDDAWAIGDDGTVGGSLGDGEHPVVVDPDGKSRRLAENPGRPGGKVFDISGDWASGWVAAENEAHWMAARWNLRTGELTYFPDAASTAVAVSANGALLSTRGGLGPSVLITPDGRIIDLPNDAAGQPSGRAINADGNVIAGNQQRLTNGSSTPAIWRRSP